MADGRLKVIITGATGFVGHRLCGSLRQNGAHVVAAVRTNISPDVLPGVKQIVAGNIDSNTNWQEALAGVDCVVHLAARVHVMREKSADPQAAFHNVNVTGTLNLAKQAQAAGVKRFVYLSSIKVNGEKTGEAPFSATDTPCPEDDYARSKYEAERGLLAMAAKCGLEVVVIRPPLVYGPGVKANFLNMMQIVEKGIPLPFGAIHNKRTLVALDNLVELIITCIDHPAAANQVFLAGDDEDLSTPDLLRRLAAAMGRPARLLPVPPVLLKFVLRMLGKGDMAQRLFGSLWIDIGKAKDVLGWQPPVGVDEGLKKTADWYLQQK